MCTGGGVWIYILETNYLTTGICNHNNQFLFVRMNILRSILSLNLSFKEQTISFIVAPTDYVKVKQNYQITRSFNQIWECFRCISFFTRMFILVIYSLISNITRIFITLKGNRTFQVQEARSLSLSRIGHLTCINFTERFALAASLVPKKVPATQEAV